MRSLAVTAALLASATTALGSTLDSPPGRVRTDTRLVPAVEAAFGKESYRPGQHALLVVHDGSRTLTLQILHVGPEIETTESDTDLHGVPVTPARTIHRRPGRRSLIVPIGNWPSGLYFARLDAADGRTGFAPFVLAPHRRGPRVAVVLPTLTWQAYNFRDDDGDGRPDSWYAGKRLDTVRLGRAYLDRGVPYGLRFHLGFLHWLDWTHKRVDVLSQWISSTSRVPARSGAGTT